MRLKDFWNDIILRFIAINVVIFLVVHLVVLLGVPQAAVAEHLALPANPSMGASHIYTVVAYMFTQWNLMHLLFNMLWFWSFGMIMRRFAIEQHAIAAAYLIGGFAGAACFMIMGALHLTDGVLIGSSAAILSVMAACGVRLAKERVQLALFGNAQVLWLSLVVIAFTLLLDVTDASRGHFGAHLAGTVAGVVYGFVLLRRRQHPTLTLMEQAELNRLLRKVKNSGHAALTPAEKTRLFQLTSKKS